jgi:cell wall-associated NlpC family hydrolase
MSLRRIRERKALAHAAKGWIGTRFVHQGRLKKTANDDGGVDCLGLLVGVANECMLMSNEYRKGLRMPLCVFDDPSYAREPSPGVLEKAITRHADIIPKPGADGFGLIYGDILLFRFQERPQHVGIVTGYDGQYVRFVHAYESAGAVVEARLDDRWARLLSAAYRLPDSAFDDEAR